MRWLLAGGSVLAAVGIYVGLAAPLPFSNDNGMAASVTQETTISSPISSTSSETTNADAAPSAPSVTPTQATPVSRSSGS